MSTPEPLKLSEAALETAKAEVDHVYWWEKKTFYTAISGGVTALIVLVSLFVVKDPATLAQIAAAAAGIGVALNSLGTVFAREGGVEAAARASRMGPGAGDGF
jgi:VIT1/CCC1 family predicted Fe2+/Mn2+ transporter